EGSPDSRNCGAWASAAKVYARLIVSTSGGERYLATSSKRFCALRAPGPVAGVEAVAIVAQRPGCQSLQPFGPYSSSALREGPGLLGVDYVWPSSRSVSRAITLAAATRSVTATCSSGWCASTSRPGP